MQADDAALIIEDGGQPLVIALLDRVGRAVTVSGAYLGADHAWQLSAPHEKAGLPVGADDESRAWIDRVQSEWGARSASMSVRQAWPEMSSFVSGGLGCSE
jgi:hypothetical protein